MRPVQTIDGGHEVDEALLDDVEVPIENLIGEENKCWDYAKIIAQIGRSKERIRRIKQWHPRSSPGGAQSSKIPQK